MRPIEGEKFPAVGRRAVLHEIHHILDKLGVLAALLNVQKFGLTCDGHMGQELPDAEMTLFRLEAPFFLGLAEKFDLLVGGEHCRGTPVGGRVDFGEN